MRSTFCAVATSTVFAALTLVAPAMAHEGHGSCKGAAQAFIVPLAQSGMAGEVASSQAQAGTLNENVAAAHAALCAPQS